MKAKNLFTRSLTGTLRIVPSFGLIGLGLKLTASPDDFHQDFNQTLPLAADGSFSLDNPNGSITITGWDKNEAAVKAVKHGGSQAEVDAMKIEVDSRANRIVIHTRCPADSNQPGFTANKHGSVDYTISVPYHARLAKIEAVNGAVNIAGVHGDITVSTVNGQTEIKDAAGRLKLETVNGQISAELVRLTDGQRASFDTVNGKIQVILPSDANATVSAETVNGGITSDFSSLGVTKEFPVGTHLAGRLGDGSARIHAETVNGAIHFEQGGKERAGAAGSTEIPKGVL